MFSVSQEEVVGGIVAQLVGVSCFSKKNKVF